MLQARAPARTQRTQTTSQARVHHCDAMRAQRAREANAHRQPETLLATAFHRSDSLCAEAICHAPLHPRPLEMPSPRCNNAMLMAHARLRAAPVLPLV